MFLPAVPLAFEMSGRILDFGAGPAISTRSDLLDDVDWLVQRKRP